MSLRVNSKISLQNFRTIIVNGYSDCFGFFKIGTSCRNRWQEVAIKYTTSTQTHQIRIQLHCLSSVTRKIMDQENMTPNKIFSNSQPKQSNNNICIEPIYNSVTIICYFYCNKVFKLEAGLKCYINRCKERAKDLNKRKSLVMNHPPAENNTANGGRSYHHGKVIWNRKGDFDIYFP